jgi:hypothetical protein
VRIGLVFPHMMYLGGGYQVFGSYSVGWDILLTCLLLFEYSQVHFLTLFEYRISSYPIVIQRSVYYNKWPVKHNRQKTHYEDPNHAWLEVLR